MHRSRLRATSTVARRAGRGRWGSAPGSRCADHADSAHHTTPISATTTTPTISRRRQSTGGARRQGRLAVLDRPQRRRGADGVAVTRARDSRRRRRRRPRARVRGRRASGAGIAAPPRARPAGQGRRRRAGRRHCGSRPPVAGGDGDVSNRDDRSCRCPSRRPCRRRARTRRAPRRRGRSRRRSPSPSGRALACHRRNARVSPATPITNAVAGSAQASASMPSAVGTSSSSPS